MAAYLIKFNFIFLIFFMLSCNEENQTKFNEEKWNERVDINFPSPYREQMLSDLLKNYKLIGLKYDQLVELLGNPNFRDSNYIGYTIKVNYGRDIDPVYTKNLNFIFSKDSIVQSYKVEEWEK